MKTCSKCKVEKDESEYNKHNKCRGGILSYCKQCERIKQLNWYSKNKDRIKNKSKNNYYDNRGRRLAMAKDYRKKNKERVSKAKSLSYQKKKSYYYEKQAAYSRKSIQELKNWYLRHILKNQEGFTCEQIENVPSLLDIKKTEILIHRLKKKINVKKSNNGNARNPTETNGKD